MKTLNEHIKATRARLAEKYARELDAASSDSEKADAARRYANSLSNLQENYSRPYRMGDWWY